MGVDRRWAVRLAQSNHEGTAMQLDKKVILDLLRQRGDHDHADRAGQELPDQVDTDKHAGLLERFGVNPGELLGKFAGGSGGGGGASDIMGKLRPGG